MQQFKKSLLTKLKTNWQSKLSGFILLLMACGPGPADYNEFVSYFMPEATNAAAVDARYHFSPQFFYVDSYSDTLFDNQSINAQAWSDYTKNKVSVEAASDYFYKKNTGNKTLFNALKGNKEALGYLDFLKQIDLAYKPASNEWESPELDTLKLTPLLQTAKLGLSKTKDIFIKERYAFQAIKLACMAKQYQDAINLHETSVQEAKSQTFISNWSRSRYAGALLHLDKKEDAFYHFAQVFADCPSRRKEADLSVRTWQVQFSEKALNLCKNDHEKASVYALASIQPNVDALPFLEKMAVLEPNNPTLELIMGREINKNEIYFYTQPVDYYGGETEKPAKNKSQSGSYFEQLEAFSTQCSADKNFKNQAFWLTATAYMAYTRKDFDKAESLLAQAEKLPTSNDFLKQQIDLQSILIASEKSPTISPALESKAIVFLEKYHKSDSFRKINVLGKVCALLANKYRGNTQINEAKGGWWSSCSNTKKAENSSELITNGKAKAFLISSLASYQHADGYPSGYASQHDQYAVEDSTASSSIEEVLKYYEQATPSDFDKRLFKISHIDSDYLYTLLGRRALDEHRYETAQKAFAKVKNLSDEPFVSYLNENPFFIKPNNGQAENEVFTPLRFAQKMVELNQLGLNGDANAWYLLGCGAYNAGYNGNAWILRRRAWSVMDDPTELLGFQDETQNIDRLNTDYFTNAKAKFYFEKALNLCKEPELKAKVLYMLATLEEQSFQALLSKNYPNYDDNNSDDYEAKKEAYLKKMSEIKQKEFNKYFRQLKAQTAQTKYNALLLKECSVYEDFVGK